MKRANTSRRFSIPTFLLTLLVYLPLAYGVNLADLFIVKTGTNAGGLDDHVDTVQLWLDDTVTLVDFVLEHFPEGADQVDGADGALRRNLRSWFDLRLGKNGIHRDDTDAYDALREKFTNLDAFLKQQDEDWIGPAKMPWIFYNSDWQRKTEYYYDGNGNAIDVDGDVIMDPTDPTNKPQANMRNWAAPQNFITGDVDRDSMLPKMKQGSGPNNWDFYAYWSEDIRDYGIVNKEEDSGMGPSGFCDIGEGNHMFALTITNMLRDSVTLCPDAFTDIAELHETIGDGMGSEKATSKSLKDSSKDILLVHTSPRSLTLFHELIHLTSGTDETPDAATKPTDCQALVPLRAEEARNNPDSIVFFAWSYFLEKKGNPSFRWHKGYKMRQS